MMRIIINHPHAADLALGFKTAFGTAELFQRSQNLFFSNAHLVCSGISAHGIEHVMTAGNDELYGGHKLALII